MTNELENDFKEVIPGVIRLLPEECELDNLLLNFKTSRCVGQSTKMYA